MTMLRFVIILTMAWSTGCYTMRFEVEDADHAEVVRERNSFFLWGWTPTREIDVGERCPSGVAAIREATTFGDGFFRLITLGIWSPRTAWFYCLPDETR